MTRFTGCFIAGVALTGCALKGDVRRVETQLADYRLETARSDSARAVMLARLLDEVARLQVQASTILDSLDGQRRTIFALQGTMRGEITEVRRQLVAIQELTGQSQARLGELRSEIERGSQVAGLPPREPVPGQNRAGPGDDQPGPEELFQMGVTQLRRGSPQTARLALQRVLDDHPDHGRAADAAYWIGESFRTEAPDSALAWFEMVVERYPSSARAPAALYKIGLDAERREDTAAARLAYQRVVAGYPQSEEAALAREKLRNP